MKKKRHIGRYKKTPYKQGIYKPVHSEKYKGCKHPEYRSSWELKFFQWCDKNTNVVKWGSETVVVPYISPVDGKLHRYFVDNIVTLKEGGNVKTYLVEIKPSKQTVAPVLSKRKKRSTILYENVMYAVNKSKWAAAEKYAKSKGIDFIILTEKEIFNK
jgi:hypothetical protein